MTAEDYFEEFKYFRDNFGHDEALKLLFTKITIDSEEGESYTEWVIGYKRQEKIAQKVIKLINNEFYSNESKDAFRRFLEKKAPSIRRSLDTEVKMTVSNDSLIRKYPITNS